MTKFAILAAILAVVAIAQGFPASDTDISSSLSGGDWDLFHKLIQEHFHDKNIWEPTFSAGSVRSLKPPPGGHVFGKSEYQFRTVSNVNGMTNENSGGHRIINQDGTVQESDFKP